MRLPISLTIILLALALSGCLEAPPFQESGGGTGNAGCDGDGACDLDERQSTCAQDCTLTALGATTGDSCSTFNAACGNDASCAEWLFCEVNPTQCTAPLPASCYNVLDASATCGGIDQCVSGIPESTSKSLFCAAIRCYARQQT